MTSTGLTFASPLAFVGLIPVAIAGVYFAWRRARRRDPVLGFSSSTLLSTLPRTTAAKLAWLPFALRLSVLAILVLCLARPQVPSPMVSGETEGIDIVLALDTSGTMRAADFQPKDRMYVAKKAIDEFIKTRSTDRIGLVVFAGEAASWVPLTLDYNLVAELLDEVEVGMLKDGTAIGSALATALNRLRKADSTSKVVVLLTDGDNNSGNISPLKAAAMAKELGVRVYTILIGRGGAVPFPTGKDIFGRIVYQQRRVSVNPELLRQIASETDGEAYEASDTEELDDRLSDVLDRLERTRRESVAHARPPFELFPFGVLVAFVLLVLEATLSATRLARFP